MKLSKENTKSSELTDKKRRTLEEKIKTSIDKWRLLSILHIFSFTIFFFSLYHRTLNIDNHIWYDFEYNWFGIYLTTFGSHETRLEYLSPSSHPPDHRSSIFFSFFLVSYSVKVLYWILVIVFSSLLQEQRTAADAAIVIQQRERGRRRRRRWWFNKSRSMRWLILSGPPLGDPWPFHYRSIFVVRTVSSASTTARMIRS